MSLSSRGLITNRSLNSSYVHCRSSWPSKTTSCRKLVNSDRIGGGSICHRLAGTSGPSLVDWKAYTSLDVESQEPDTVGSASRLPKQRKRPTRDYRARICDSRALVDALTFGGHSTAVPQGLRPGKVDLSYQPPRSLNKRAHHFRHHLPPELSLRSLLARYIQFVHPLLSIISLQDHSQRPYQNFSKSKRVTQVLRNILDADALGLLEANGYQVTDLVNWSWVLTAPTSLRAARRLAMLSEPRISNSLSAGRPIPTFVFLFLLRREHVDAHALKVLILHAKQRLQLRGKSLRDMRTASKLDAAVKSDAWSSRHGQQPKPGLVYPVMSETTLMVMYVRLIRHARRTLPVALTSIVILFSQHMHGQSHRNGSSEMVPDERTGARLTFLYNKALHLLAIPSVQHPFLSVPHHQRAQFVLLKRMNEFSPALIITREGYRAIARVQLAHRKTLRERDWAGLKARSWPPWKEDRLGLDVEKSVEYGTSRASESLMRLQEAGYCMKTWESAAEIYAGWDTDHSPTIQTRIRFPASDSEVEHPDIVPEMEPQIERYAIKWQARIRASRTLNEAWACFLVWRKRAFVPSLRVYYVMLEKLIFDRKRQKLRGKPGAMESSADNELQVLPGDGKEVWSEPVSPQEATYVQTPPPSVDAFFNYMVASGIKPSGRFLAFLISHAESLQTAVKYIEASGLPVETIRFLIDGREDKIPEIQDLITRMPDYLFTAYIRLLSRYPYLEDGLSAFDKSMDESAEVTSRHRLFYRDRLAYAFQLMAARSPRYLPPWYCILSAIAHSKSVIVASLELDEDAQAIFSWKLMRKVFRRMEAIDLTMDFQGFQIICVGLEKAILASKRYLSGNALEAKKNNPSADLTSEAQAVQSTGPHFVKGKFTELTTPPFLVEQTVSPPPNPDHSWQDWLEVPGPSQLHAFIRVLGLCQDYDGLLELILWMVQFAPELEAVADEASNGARLTRRCMIATRVFLEQSWTSNDDAGEAEEHENGLAHETAPPNTIQKVSEAIESVVAWGGWPTDREVGAYCEKGRFM